MTTDTFTFSEAVLQLLRSNISPLRTLVALSQHSLVLRQTQPHGVKDSMVQRDDPPGFILLLPACMGLLPVHTRLSRRLGCYAPQYDCAGILGCLAPTEQRLSTVRSSKRGAVSRRGELCRSSS